MPRKKQTREKASIEDIYRNKHFVPPKEQNLETIFEEPRQNKDGAPVLTSVKKYKRYLHFDPTQNKIQKRKRNAKKCMKKMKSSYRVTRSSPKNSKCDDTLMYLMDILSESDESDMDVSSSSNRTKVSGIFPSHVSKSSAEAACTSSSARGVLSPEYFDTPKRTLEGRKSQTLYKSDIQSNIASDILNNNSDELPVNDPDECEKLSNESPEDTNSSESPRRSCYIS